MNDELKNQLAEACRVYVKASAKAAKAREAVAEAIAALDKDCDDANEDAARAYLQSHADANAKAATTGENQ